MSFRFKCPKCTKKLKAAEDQAGRRCSCTGCGHSFAIPQTTSPASPLPVAKPVDSQSANRNSVPEKPSQQAAHASDRQVAPKRNTPLLDNAAINKADKTWVQQLIDGAKDIKRRITGEDTEEVKVQKAIEFAQRFAGDLNREKSLSINISDIEYKYRNTRTISELIQELNQSTEGTNVPVKIALSIIASKSGIAEEYLPDILIEEKDFHPFLIDPHGKKKFIFNLLKWLDQLGSKRNVVILLSPELLEFYNKTKQNSSRCDICNDMEESAECVEDRCIHIQTRTETVYRRVYSKHENPNYDRRMPGSRPYSESVTEMPCQLQVRYETREKIYRCDSCKKSFSREYVERTVL